MRKFWKGITWMWLLGIIIWQWSITERVIIKAEWKPKGDFDQWMKEKMKE